MRDGAGGKKVNNVLFQILLTYSIRPTPVNHHICCRAIRLVLVGFDGEVITHEAAVSLRVQHEDCHVSIRPEVKQVTMRST